MGVDDPKQRFPKSVYGEGTDPDPRFSLANERTFLAWIRTALGLMAAAVALAALPSDISEPFGTVTASVLVGLGIATAIYAWLGWCRVERSLRLNESLPAPTFSLVMTAVLVGAGLAIAVDVFL